MKNVDSCNRLLSLINQTTYKGQSQVNLTYFLQQQTPKKILFFFSRYATDDIMCDNSGSERAGESLATITLARHQTCCVRQRIVLAIGVFRLIFFLVYSFIPLLLYPLIFASPSPLTKKRVAPLVTIVERIHAHKLYIIHARMHTTRERARRRKKKTHRAAESDDY